MAIKTIQELKEEVLDFPEQYKAVLEKRTQAILESERLKREISNLKEQLSSETDSIEDSDDEDVSLLELETGLAKLKLELNFTESSVELSARRAGEKVTESTIKAMVATDDQVLRLKHRLIDDEANYKTRRSESNRLRQEQRIRERSSRRQIDSGSDNPEINALESQLVEAQKSILLADDETDVLRARLDAFRLVVGLENLEAD